MHVNVFLFSIKIIVGAIVCEEAKLRGDITIGAGTIVHPCASIIADAGPIVIGERCLIEEQSKIIHRYVTFFYTTYLWQHPHAIGC